MSLVGHRTVDAEEDLAARAGALLAAGRAAQALLGEAQREISNDPRRAAESLRNFWLRYPEHPAAETARAAERDLGVGLPEPSGRDLLLRASRLLASGHPAAAQAQADIAAT